MIKSILGADVSLDSIVPFLPPSPQKINTSTKSANSPSTLCKGQEKKCIHLQSGGSAEVPAEGATVASRSGDESGSGSEVEFELVEETVSTLSLSEFECTRRPRKPRRRKKGKAGADGAVTTAESTTQGQQGKLCCLAILSQAKISLSGGYKLHTRSVKLGDNTEH